MKSRPHLFCDKKSVWVSETGCQTSNKERVSFDKFLRQRLWSLSQWVLQLFNFRNFFTWISLPTQIATIVSMLFDISGILVLFWNMFMYIFKMESRKSSCALCYSQWGFLINKQINSTSNNLNSLSSHIWKQKVFWLRNAAGIQNPAAESVFCILKKGTLWSFSKNKLKLCFHPDFPAKMCCLSSRSS